MQTYSLTINDFLSPILARLRKKGSEVSTAAHLKVVRIIYAPEIYNQELDILVEHIMLVLAPHRFLLKTKHRARR